MAVTIYANIANYIENGTIFTQKADDAKIAGNNYFFAGNKNLANDPIAQKRKEAQEAAWKVVSDAWDIDKSIDKNIENRQNHYNEMMGIKQEAQNQINEIQDEIDALKEEYGVTDEMKYKDWPDEYRERYFNLADQAGFFKKQINDADKLMKDDIADIKEITRERLKSDPMADAQKTADDIAAAANDEIIGMAMEQAKENIDEKLEENAEAAEEKAEEEQIKEEQLEKAKEKRALQEALIAGTKEAAEEAEARRKETEISDLPLDDLIKLTQTNAETSKVQTALNEIKTNMKLLDADLKGIEIDESI